MDGLTVPEKEEPEKEVEDEVIGGKAEPGEGGKEAEKQDGEEDAGAEAGAEVPDLEPEEPPDELPDLSLDDIGKQEEPQPGSEKGPQPGPESGPESGPEPGPEKDDTATRADDEDAKKELEEIRGDPHTPAKTQKAVDRLLGKIAHLKKIIGDKDAEVSAGKSLAESAAKKAAEAPPIASEERKELNMLRRRYSLDKDEGIKAYDDRAKAAESLLVEVVKSTLDEEQGKAIEKMGIDAFAKMPKAFREFLELLDENDPAQGALVRTKYAEMVGLRREKEEKVKELTGESEAWIAEQEKKFAEQQNQREEYGKQIEQLKQEFYANTINHDPYFKLKDTTGAKGEALARAEADNAQRTVYHAELQRILNANSLNEQKKVIYRAALARPLADQVRGLTAQVKGLKDKLAKIDEARNTRPRHSTGDVKPPTQDDKPKDFAERLSEIVGYRV